MHEMFSLFFVVQVQMNFEKFYSKWISGRRAEKLAICTFELDLIFPQCNGYMCFHTSHAVTQQTSVMSMALLLIFLTSHSQSQCGGHGSHCAHLFSPAIHSTWQWRRTKDGGAEGAGPSVSAEIPVFRSERQDLRWWWCRAKMEEQRGRSPHLFLLS